MNERHDLQDSVKSNGLWHLSQRSVIWIINKNKGLSPLQMLSFFIYLNNSILFGIHFISCTNSIVNIVAMCTYWMILLFQVDAMKVGVKEFKKEYKNVNIDNIEVSESR